MKFVKLNENKEPLTKLEEKCYEDTFKQWENAGLIIGTDVIVLDFDGDNPNEDKITEYIEKNYPTLCVKTNRGKHYYFAMPKEYKFNHSVKAVSVLGFQCDYLTGEKAFAVIKLKGKARETNKDLSFENLPVLPQCFFPLNKAKGKMLAGMVEGDARNDKLFLHLRCIREAYPEIDIDNLAKDINNYIFTESLDKKELKALMKSVKKASIANYDNKNKIDGLCYSTAKDLKNKELIPIVFYVDKIIPQGLNLLCSVPKIGKSWLALDLCISISNGQKFLGFDTKKAGCLYLALEDSVNRLQARLNKLLDDKDGPDNFRWSINAKNISGGLINQLEQFIKDNPDVKVIVIDTLQKIRSDYNGNSNYANDYKEISMIKNFADKNGLCIILIHHLRKADAFGDVFERISGTNGIMGTVDTAYTLHKKDRNDAETYLSITGRDVDYNQFVIKFNKEKCKWEFISSVEEQKNIEEIAEYFKSSLIQTIKKLVNENNGNWDGTYKELIKFQKDSFEDSNNPEKARKEVERFADLLKSIDKIEYIPAKYPKNGKRIQIFKKITVDSVAP